MQNSLFKEIIGKKYIKINSEFGHYEWHKINEVLGFGDWHLESRPEGRLRCITGMTMSASSCLIVYFCKVYKNFSTDNVITAILGGAQSRKKAEVLELILWYKLLRMYAIDRLNRGHNLELTIICFTFLFNRQLTLLGDY